MHAELLKKLFSMQDRDLATRSRLLAEGRLYGDYAAEMQQIHNENARELAAIVAEHGWPGYSLVGEDGCRAAWMIAQHAIGTPDQQRGFLAALKRAVEAGEASARMAALLTDRIRFNEGRPQIYGTVLDWDGNGELNCEVEDSAGLDRRRADAALPPFAEDLIRHRREVEAEGGKPPADLQDYRRRQEAWARAAGWR